MDKVKVFIMQLPREQLQLVKGYLGEREKKEKMSSKVHKMLRVFSKCTEEEQMMFLEGIKSGEHHYCEEENHSSSGETKEEHPVKGDNDLDLMEHFNG